VTITKFRKKKGCGLTSRKLPMSTIGFNRPATTKTWMTESCLACEMHVAYGTRCDTYDHTACHDLLRPLTTQLRYRCYIMYYILLLVT
jgi:hypothetical protein